MHLSENPISPFLAFPQMNDEMPIDIPFMVCYFSKISSTAGIPNAVHYFVQERHNKIESMDQNVCALYLAVLRAYGMGVASSDHG
jgi:hypothetical protein